MFARTFLAAAAIYVVVMVLAVRARGEAFKAFWPGMLPPMGLLFAFIVGFLAAQVWSDAGQAQEAINREASALRSMVVLVHAFPASSSTVSTRSFATTSQGGRRRVASDRPTSVRR